MNMRKFESLAKRVGQCSFVLRKCQDSYSDMNRSYQCQMYDDEFVTTK